MDEAETIKQLGITWPEYHKRRKQVWSRARAIEQDMRKLYYHSDQWKWLRSYVLSRDTTCRYCLKRPSTEVHHLTYKNLFHESPFELIGVCRACHQLLSDFNAHRK